MHIMCVDPPRFDIFGLGCTLCTVANAGILAPGPHPPFTQLPALQKIRQWLREVLARDPRHWKRAQGASGERWRLDPVACGDFHPMILRGDCNGVASSALLDAVVRMTR